MSAMWGNSDSALRSPSLRKKSRVAYSFLTGWRMTVFHFSGATFLTSDM